MTIENVININNGMDRMLRFIASTNLKDKIELKALVIPQAGQLIPVTCLKIHITGINLIINKDTIKIAKMQLFFVLLLIYNTLLIDFILNLLMGFYFHLYLYFLLI